MYIDAEDYTPFDDNCAVEPAAGYTRHNDEMNLAWQFIANTNVSVFLTGKAGTGKTTFLRRLRQLMPKRMVVLAPTGVAAINAGGQTIHSFFQLPFGPFIPGRSSDDNQKYRMAQWKKNLIRTLDLLVIDEVSMVRADLLDLVDDTLRRYRDAALPFGGVQLLLIGDLMQLSPVAANNEWALLAPYYQTPYFFSSNALRQHRYVTVELKHIYRQQDQDFINILGEVRSGCISAETIRALNSRYMPVLDDEHKDWILLTTHNLTAQQHNDHRMSMLDTPEHKFEATVKGDFPELSYPTDYQLTLKVGAQVMFIKNDPIGRFYNGKIGTVTDIKGQTVVVDCQEGESIEVGPALWENTKYSLDPDSNEIKEETAGTFSQLPLRLAWAITVHKSQGLTFDHAVLDINSSFAHGQVYVALSRCRTLEGLALTSQLHVSSIITDSTVNSYIDSELQAIPSNVQQLPRMKYEYKMSLLDELYCFDPIIRGLNWLIRVVDEHLSRQQPDLLAELKDGAVKIQAKLTSVAAKFSLQYHQLMQQHGGNIASSPLAKRIMEASVYFSKCLSDIFLPIFGSTPIHIENKQVAQTYNNAVRSLKMEVITKSMVLDTLAKEPFSTSLYLKTKAKALLEAQKSDLPGQKGNKAPKPKKERPEKEKTEKKKAPKKGSTVLETLQLFESGLTVEQICQHRQLQPSTIYGHLAAMVAAGRLNIDRVVSPERQALIREAVASFSESYTLTDVKKALPEDISFGEIRMVIADDSVGL